MVQKWVTKRCTQIFAEDEARQFFNIVRGSEPRVTRERSYELRIPTGSGPGRCRC